MDLEAVKSNYITHEVGTYWDDEGYLVFKIDELIGLNEFIPIAIAYWENYSELITPQTCYIINTKGERSIDFFLNLDSELKEN